MRFYILLAMFAMLAPLAALSQSCNSEKNPTIDRKVASLIEKMVHKRTEHKAFADLEALGCQAVPFIIQRMDDRRKLPDPTISLENKSPDAFERLRHYGPEKVVDALDAILNQLTGQGGAIVNGGSDAERKKAAQGWREWLSKTPAEKRCI